MFPKYNLLRHDIFQLVYIPVLSLVYIMILFLKSVYIYICMLYSLGEWKHIFYLAVLSVYPGGAP